MGIGRRLDLVLEHECRFRSTLRQIASAASCRGQGDAAHIRPTVVCICTEQPAEEICNNVRETCRIPFFLYSLPRLTLIRAECPSPFFRNGACATTGSPTACRVRISSSAPREEPSTCRALRPAAILLYPRVEGYVARSNPISRRVSAASHVWPGVWALGETSMFAGEAENPGGTAPRLGSGSMPAPVLSSEVSVCEPSEGPGRDREGEEGGEEGEAACVGIQEEEEEDEDERTRTKTKTRSGREQGRSIQSI